MPDMGGDELALGDAEALRKVAVPEVIFDTGLPDVGRQKLSLIRHGSFTRFFVFGETWLDSTRLTRCFGLVDVGFVNYPEFFTQIHRRTQELSVETVDPAWNVTGDRRCITSFPERVS
ncbi:hypothetical protein NBRC116599_16800 [Aquicoccus sp. SU-CL01552]